MTYRTATPEEVAAINARIEELERPYHAVNGHIMIRPAHITPDNRVVSGSSAHAYCAPACAEHGACSEGMGLPEDW